MKPQIYRGFEPRAAMASLSLLGLVYGGAFLVLWTLGLVIRGSRGWLLVLTPLALVAGLRLWAWRRLSVEVADGVLRFEGVSAKDDFEVALESIEAVYFDSMLPGRPLVLALHDGDERVIEGLRTGRAEELRAHLIDLGARDPSPA